MVAGIRYEDSCDSLGALFCRMRKLQGDGFDCVQLIVKDIDEVLFTMAGSAKLSERAGVENKFAQ